MKRITFALFAAAVGAAVLSFGGQTVPTPYTWTVGDADRYEVTWTTSARATLPFDDAEPFDVSSHLVGTFDVYTVSRDVDGSVLQRGQLSSVESLVVTVSGQAVPVAASAMLGVAVELQRDAHGVLVDARVSSAAPAATANTLLGLAKTFAVPDPSQTERRTPFGVAIDGWAGDMRTTETFASLTGAPGFATLVGSGVATVQFGDGRLRQIEASDSARAVSNGTLWLDTHDASSWRWTGAVPTRTEVAQAPHRLSVPPAVPNESTGWTPGEILSRVHAFAPGDDAGPVMWHGTRRLSQDPGLRQRIARLAARPDTSHARRELLLDLLAHTPGGRGEPDLLDALTALETAPHFAAYLQRLSFLDAPTDASVEALRRWMLEPEDVGRAAHTALGAVAANHPLPDAVLADLRGPLSPDPEQAASTLAGLGNAHQPADLAALSDATDDSRARVRAAALHALRHYPDAGVLPDVLVGTADPHPGVQRAALSVLADRSLTPSSLEPMIELAVAGAVHADNLGLLVTVLSRYTEQPRIRLALASVLEHPAAGPELRGRVRTMLARESG